jgi:enoyl-CoA hydratase/carnithine racemase
MSKPLPTTRIELETKDDVAIVTLNGPPKNEMGIEFFTSLSHFAKTLTALDIRGMIIQGAGRHFSSGADVPEIEKLGANSTTEVAALLESNIESFLTLSRLHYPVVALVRGCCLGAGFELALACHYRVAEQNAVFSLPEAALGIMPGCGGTIRLPSLIGKANAAEIILSGRLILADEAGELGIADRTVERGHGLNAAIDLINRPSTRNSK